MEIFLCILAFLSLQQDVEASATLEWTLLKYENHGGRDSKDRKCDIFNKCDHIFEFSVETDSEVVWSQRSQVFWNQNKIVFSTGASNKGVYNPISVSFNKWPNNAIYFKAKVLDSDKDFLNNNDNVASLSSKVFVEPDATKDRSYNVQTFAIDKGKILTFKYRVYCDDNYYGNNCTKKCFPRDDNIQGHFRCLTNGAILCLSGWENEEQLCLDRQDDCEKNNCQNGAKCQDASKSYTCVCRAGFTGQYCEVETNECAPKPCKNDGVCNDVVAGFTCTCKSGYVGLTCSETACKTASPCQNNGICYGDQQCMCTEHFYGKHCTQQLCKKTGCKNGGVCSITGKCQCPAGVIGVACETVLCNIMADFCKNGGQCSNGKCDCPSNFSGPTCETSSLCANYFCENGGVCKRSYDIDAKKLVLFCKCLPGFSGNLCKRVAIEEKLESGEDERISHSEISSQFKNRYFKGLMIALGVIVILLIICMVLMILLCRQKRRLRKKPLFSTLSSDPSMFSEGGRSRTFSSSTMRSEVCGVSGMTHGPNDSIEVVPSPKSISELSLARVRNTALPNVYDQDKKEDVKQIFESDYEHLKDKVEVPIVSAM